MERRRFIRYKENSMAIILQNDTAIEGKTVDLSQNGLRLILPEKPKETKDIPVSLTLPIGIQEMTADVSWMQSVNKNEYIIGLYLNSTPVEYLNYTATIKYSLI
jgi:hypothetical protein